MQAFSRVSLTDAEVGVHKVFQDFGFTAPIKIDYIDLGQLHQLKKFPYIKLSTWMTYLLETNRLSKQMCGVATIAKMRPVLVEFWKRFKQINPTHGIFSLEAEGVVALDSTIPFYSHTDEGRSVRHLPLFVLSSHGALSRGTQAYLKNGRHRAPLRRNSMGLNFVGKTWSTNFIFTAVLKTVSVECPDAISKLVEQYASDVYKLMVEGIHDKNGVRFTFAHIGTKGDLPALLKLGAFKRSYSNVPRGPRSKKACTGICHACLAGQERDDAIGQERVPFEDVNETARWVSTVCRTKPWDHTPPILQGLPLDTEQSIRFFCTDLWHNAHLGVCKHFVASGFVEVLESNLASVPQGSMEVKFNWLTNLYRGYFKDLKKTPYVADINRDTMNFPASTACPLGKWSKGAASTEMMMFLDHFGDNYIKGKTDDSLLVAIVSWYIFGTFSLIELFCFSSFLASLKKTKLRAFVFQTLPFHCCMPRLMHAKHWIWLLRSCTSLAFGSGVIRESVWLRWCFVFFLCTPSVRRSRYQTAKDVLQSPPNYIWWLIVQ